MIEKSQANTQNAMKRAFFSLANSIDGVADLGTVICSINPINVSGRDATIEKLLSAVFTSINSLQAVVNTSPEVDELLATTVIDELESAAKAMKKSISEFAKRESSSGEQVLISWIQLRDKLEYTGRDVGVGNET